MRSHTLYHLVKATLGAIVACALRAVAAAADSGNIEAGEGSGAAAKSAKSNQSSEQLVSQLADFLIAYLPLRSQVMADGWIWQFQYSS